VGVIGNGNQSVIDIPAFLQNDDVQVLAVCDVNTASGGYRTPQQFLGRKPAQEQVNRYYAEKTGRGQYQGCDAYRDFREVLGRSVFAVRGRLVGIAGLDAIAAGGRSRLPNLLYETSGKRSDVSVSLLGSARAAPRTNESQMTVPEVRAVLRHLLALRQWDVDEIVAWSNRRMDRNRVAQECHAARRREQLRRRSRKKARRCSTTSTATSSSTTAPWACSTIFASMRGTTANR
jgi:hypothetical protein